MTKKIVKAKEKDNEMANNVFFKDIFKDNKNKIWLFIYVVIEWYEYYKIDVKYKK